MKILKITFCFLSLAFPAFLFSDEVIKEFEIVGSSTVFPHSSAVALEVQNEYPEITISMKSTGSGGGAKLFCQGQDINTPSITNASRRIKNKEVSLCKQNGVLDVTEYRIGYDGIVIMHSIDFEPLSLTRENLFYALNSTLKINGIIVENPYKKWSEIDSSLPDIDIKIMGPPSSSGTRDSFEELVLEEFSDKSGVPLKIREDGVYIEAGENDNAIINKLSSDKNLLGIAGYSFLAQNEDKVVGALIDGFYPSFENIALGNYPISRSLWFYVKNNHIDKKPGIRLYVDEFTDEDTWGEDGYLSDLGLIPLSDDDREIPEFGVANGPFSSN